MFQRKRWICVLLALVVLLSGCGSGSGGKRKDDDMVTLWMLTEVYVVGEGGDKTVFCAYAYDENGLMIQKAENNQKDVTDYRYDKDGNCLSTTRTYKISDGEVLVDNYVVEHSYDYDKNGRAIAMYRQDGSLIQEYQYYKNGNLRKWAWTKGTGAGAISITRMAIL